MLLIYLFIKILLQCAVKGKIVGGVGATIGFRDARSAKSAVKNADDFAMATRSFIATVCEIQLQSESATFRTRNDLAGAARELAEELNRLQMHVKETRNILQKVAPLDANWIL